MKRTCLQRNTNTGEQSRWLSGTCEFHPTEILFNGSLLDPEDISQVKSSESMKTYSLYLVLILLALLTGCEKNNDADYIYQGMKIKEIRNEQNKLIAEYHYDRQGRLKSMWEKPFFTLDDGKTELNYTYNNDGRLTACSGILPGNPLMSSYAGAMDKNIIEEYAYNSDGKLAKVTSNYSFDEYSDMDFSYIREYSYPSEDTVEMKSYNSYSEDPASYNLVVFIYVDGNISEMKQYYTMDGNDEVLSYYEKYTYDDKLNPFRNPLIPENSSLNNMTKKEAYYFNGITNTDLIEIVIKPSVFTYAYEYNRSNYPTKQTTTNPNETIVIKHFKY